MFVSPKTAIESGWVKGWDSIDWNKYIQPNALDFSIDHLRIVTPTDPALVSETNKIMRSTSKIVPTTSKLIDELTWKINHNVVYDGMSRFYVDIPDGVAAYLITRSTFARNGVFIQSGLYDAKFRGNIGFTVYPIGGSMEIVPGTRIGQLIFVKSDSEGGYAGQYNTENGQHWTAVVK
jgi:deoxycytidine triphosphate deaminase